MHLRGIGYGVVSAALFGLGAVLAKLVTAEIDIAIASFLVLLVGGLLLAGCLALTRRTPVSVLFTLKRADWLQIFLLACPGTALPLLVILAGFAHTTALEGGLLLQLNGLAALVFSVLLLGERVRSKQSVGILLLLLGGVLVVVAGRGEAIGAGGSLLGDGLLLLGTIGIGFGYIPAKRLAERVDPLTLSALRLLVSAGTLIPILAIWLLLAGHTLLWRPSLTSLWVVPTYIVGNFCLAYLTQQAGLRLLKAWEMAALAQTVPIFSTLFAVLLLHDQLTLLQGVGGALAVLGGLVVSLGAQAPSPPTVMREEPVQEASAKQQRL